MLPAKLASIAHLTPAYFHAPHVWTKQVPSQSTGRGPTGAPVLCASIRFGPTTQRTGRATTLPTIPQRGAASAGGLPSPRRRWMVRELSLFTGAGGGLLGTVHLLGWRPVGYVEWDEYCCRVIEQRIRDGLLPRAPIWQMDIREFNARVADRYRGMVDVITAGFPCQPFSVAGLRRGEEDERNMWPATIECVRLVRPRRVCLENSPSLLRSPYWGTIVGDLARVSSCVRWCCLSAADLGFKHLRRRLWAVADASSRGRECRWGQPAHADVRAMVPQHPWERKVFDGLCRVDDGTPNWVDRCTAVGNMQVPLVAATAWRLLGGE